MTWRSTTTLTGLLLLITGLIFLTRSGQSAADDPSPPGNVRANSNSEAAGTEPSPHPPVVAPSLVDLNRAAEKKIRQAMQTKIDVTLKDQPLNAFLTSLAEKAEIPLVLNETALREEGLAGDELLNDEFHNVTIEHALNWICRPRGMAWLIDDEVLKVTTAIDAEEKLFTRTYDVGDWISNKDTDEAEEALYADIVIGTSGRWPESGGVHGTMSFQGDVLVVRQPFRVQQEVAALLSAMSVMKNADDSLRSIRVEPESYPHERDKQIEAALRERISVNYRNRSLSLIAAELAKQHQIRIRILTKPLKEEGIIATDEPVSLAMNEVSLGATLKLLLEPLGLTYYVFEGVLWITTEIDAEDFLQTTLYDVRDLVSSADDYDRLAEIVPQQTSGPWEMIEGTGGNVSASQPKNVLVIRQTYRVHQEIAQLLADLRATIAAQPQKVRPNGESNPIVTRIYRSTGQKFDDDLVTVVPRFVARESWGADNKEAAIQRVGEMLVIRNTLAVHKQVEQFLREFGYQEQSSNGLGLF